MKRFLLPFVFAATLLAGCDKEEAKPSPPTPPTTPTTPAGPTASYTLTSNGAPVSASMTCVGYGPVTAADGTRPNIATIYVFLPTANRDYASIKYYLTSTEPFGSVNSVAAGPYNNLNANLAATGTLTSRTITTNGVTKRYLSGTFTANLGPGYTAATGSFTDVEARP